MFDDAKIAEIERICRRREREKAKEKQIY